jgi:hypothetical protein
VPVVAFAPPKSSIKAVGPDGFETALVDADPERLEPCCWLPLRLLRAFTREVLAGTNEEELTWKKQLGEFTMLTTFVGMRLLSAST